MNIKNQWTEVVLGEVLKIGSGKDYKHLNKGDIPVYGTGGLMLRVDKFLHNGETVFIGRKGTIDKPFYFNGKFWTVDTLFYTHSFKKTTAKYVYLLFQIINWKKYNEASGVPSLSKSTIEKIKVELPPITEQNRIVSILQTWDQAIEKLKKKIELKKNIKRGLMQQLLTGKRRLGGFSGEWEKYDLEKLSIFRRGSFPQPYGLDKWYDDKNGKPFIQVYDVAKNMRLKPRTKRKISREAQKYSVFVPRGTILLTIQGSIGRIALTNYDAYVDRTLLIFESFIKEINKSFFMYSVYVLFQKEKTRADGGTIKTITKDTLRSFQISYPSLEEQNSIAEVINKSYLEIEKLEHKLNLYMAQKTHLLNTLITGKIRTPENLLEKVA